MSRMRGLIDVWLTPQQTAIEKSSQRGLLAQFSDGSAPGGGLGPLAHAQEFRLLLRWTMRRWRACYRCVGGVPTWRARWSPLPALPILPQALRGAK